MASVGLVWSFCIGQIYVDMVLNTTVRVSFACCKWWPDAATLVLEKFYGRCKKRTRNGGINGKTESEILNFVEPS